MDVPAEIIAKREDWINATLDWVRKILEEHPPANGDPDIRKAALLALDDVLHLIDAPHLETVQRFFAERISGALEEILETNVTDGVVIWKLYDHGFVVKTPHHTVGFDLCRGVYDMTVPLEQIKSLSKVMDSHFISHAHEDHMDVDLVIDLLQSGKPVMMPPSAADFWKEHEIISKARLVREGAFQVDGLDITVFPSYQVDLENNWYLMTLDGVTICHTGDEEQENDFAWIDNIWREYKVDVLLPNCWAEDILRLIHGVNPVFVITGHENELGHPVDHRASYEETYKHLQDLRHAHVIMTWGEKVYYSSPTQAVF